MFADGSRAERALALMAALVFLQLGVVRAAEKYLSAYPTLPIMLALLAATGAIYALLIYRGGGPLMRLLDGPVPAVLVIAGALVVTLWLYPKADSLKALGRGSDQDDCVVLVARNLIEGLAPYARSTSYVGNPCSTGPGVALLYLPLVAAGLYGLGGALVLAACAAALRLAERGWFGANAFLLLLASSAVVWELLAVGSDFFLIGGGLVVVLVLLERWRDSLPLAAVVGLAVLAGMIASGRTVLLYTPLVFALMLWRRSLPKAVLFAAVGMATGIGLTAGAYLMSPQTFTPLHLLGKGGAISGSGGGVTGALTLCLPAVALALWLGWRGQAQSWRTILALCIGAPMAYFAAANFAQVGAVRSEGPNYLLLAALPIAAWIAAVAERTRQALDEPDPLTA